MNNKSKRNKLCKCTSILSGNVRNDTEAKKNNFHDIQAMMTFFYLFKKYDTD